MSSKGTKTYNRSDIELELLSQFPDLTKKQIRLAIDSIIESIVDSVAFDEKVELRGFGSFRIRQRNARVGRNPKSGQKVDVPSKKVPFFKAGKELRELVDEREAEEAAREEQENP